MIRQPKRARRGRWILAVALGSASALILAAAALASPTITEYSQGLWSGAAPMDIVKGPDGNMWFTDNSTSGAIGRITPSGQITRFGGLTAGAPRGIALGPDNNLWFVESGGTGAIGRITPTGTITEYTSGLSSSSAPISIAAGPDGNLWFTESASPGRIGKITPTGTITEYTTGLTANSTPWYITAGPDGNMWFTEKFNPGRIGKITPSGTITEYSTGIASGVPQEIAAGPDGNVWFTQASSPGRIGRITPSGTITEFSSGLSTNANPEGIASGPDGNLYFTEHSGSAAIGEITPTGVITEFGAGLSSSSSPWGIAAGAGRMWFADNSLPAIGMFTVAAGSASGTPTSGNGRPKSGTDNPTSGTGTLPPPVLGKTVLVSVSSGSVLVRPPRSGTFADLAGAASIPNGSVIDARRGTVQLVDAENNSGATQTATFHGAVFQIRQAPSTGGMTDIILTGGDFRGCGRARSARAAMVVAARARRVVRRLWGHDSHGHFRTHGSHLIATVRGTTWLTADRCDGTLARVVEGQVSVRDMSRRRSVIVRAGQSYLARAR